MPKHRIAIITNDILTTRMAGPAIRAWHMAELLAADHDVRLVSTVYPCELSSPLFRTEVRHGDVLTQIEEWCDVLIFQGTVMYEHPFLRDSNKILVVDMYNPMHLETLEQARDRGEELRRLDVRNSTLLINEQLARGDFFLAASPKQRDFWLGHLAAVGRVNTVTYDDDSSLRRLIATAPFGLAEQPPQHRRPALKGVVPGIGIHDRVVLWGGGIYNWFDPLTLIKAIDRLRRRKPEVRLYFLGLKHPNPLVPTMRKGAEAVALAERLGLVGRHIFFNHGWVPYDDRANYLLESDIGVSTHLEHVETAFSFRTRILDYLWAGLPVVTTEGDFFADLVERDGLGLTVPARDVSALEGALYRLLDDGDFAAECRAQSTATAQHFTWPEVLGPLIEFCDNPRRAPDLLDSELANFAGKTAGPVRPPTGIVDNLHILLDHWAAGGYRRVASRSWSRIRYQLTGNRHRLSRGRPPSA
jgi:glycosyltransferase involved in cell wall biosynthesis